MKILCLTPWFPAFPGDQMGSFVLDSVTALKDLGHEVKVLHSRPWRPRLAKSFNQDWANAKLDCRRYSGSLEIRQVHHLSIPRNYLRFLSNWHFHKQVFARLRSAVTSWRPDIIHAHTELPGCVAVEVAKETGLPSVVTMHGEDTCPRMNSTRQVGFYRRWLKRANRIVLVGQPLWEYFARVIGRSDHFRVVPNGFRLWNEETTVDRRSWSDPVRLVSLSNLNEGKGIDITLESLHRLSNSGVDKWTYKVVGDGAERTKLERLTDALALRDKVKFVGACSHREVASHLSGHDVFVLPSYREAFGVAYLEAMAMGLLAIGVEGQGPSAFIDHGKTGMLVKPRSVDSLCSRLREVIHDRDSMRMMAAAGRRFVNDKYSMRHHGEQLIEVYSEAMGEIS